MEGNGCSMGWRGCMRLAMIGIAVAVAIVGCDTRTEAAGPPPGLDVEPIVRALGDAGIPASVETPDGDIVLVKRPTTAFRSGREGKRELAITLEVRRKDGIRYLRMHAAGIHVAAPGDATEHVRRVVAAAGCRLHGPVAASMDDLTGSVNLLVVVPLADPGLPSDQVAALVDSLVRAADLLYPTLRRAARTGKVKWANYDEGPRAPAHQGTPVDVEGEEPHDGPTGWAPHVATQLYASTAVAAARVMSGLMSGTAAEREAIANEIVDEYGGIPARRGREDVLASAAALEDSYPPFAVRCFGAPGTKVWARFSAPGLLRVPAQAEETIDEFGWVDVRPVPEWDVDALRRIEEARDVAVEFEVSGAGITGKGHQSVRVLPIGVGDMRMPAAMGVAAYVDETHPWIDDLVREAADLGMCDAICAHERTTFADAVPQLFALWTALRNRDIGYFSMVEATEAHEHGQRVRRLHEAIASRGANCADGSVLLASILRAVGFDVHLVHMPEHILVAVYLPGEPDVDWIFIESSTIDDPAPAVPSHRLDAAREGVADHVNGEAWASFNKACDTGWRVVSEAIAEGEVVFNSVKSLRKLGLRPITVAESAIGPIPPRPDQEALAARRERAWARSKKEAAEADGETGDEPTPVAVGQ